MKPLLLGLLALTLSGCSIFQSAYDSEAIRQCRELPNQNERLACERQAEDDARARRAEDLRDQ